MDLIDEIRGFVLNGEITFGTKLIVPEEPVVVGSLFEVSARFARRQATITVGDKVYEIKHREVLQLRADKNHDIEIVLNVQGKRPVTKTIKTISVKPIVAIDTIPEKVSYLDNFLNTRFFVENAKSKLLLYSFDEEHWENINTDDGGNFVIPVPNYLGEIFIRGEYKSVSFPCDPMACVQLYKRIVVQHPNPTISTPDTLQVDRFGESTFTFVISEATGLNLNHNETIHSTYSKENGDYTVDIIVDTTIVGDNVFEIETRTRNDEWISRRFNIVVNPRKMVVELVEEGYYHRLTMSGANEATLHVPSRSIVKEVPLKGGKISHNFYCETSGYILAIDDLGETIRNDIVFKPKKFTWPKLPDLHKLGE